MMCPGGKAMVMLLAFVACSRVVDKGVVNNALWARARLERVGYIEEQGRKGGSPWRLARARLGGGDIED